METTFMTIHNLGREAKILFASESIVDILGFQPEEVIGRSSFDYFHPDELVNARDVHTRGVQMDRAAVLHYARIQNRAGEWVSCECVFTIVYEVLVACTSIYRRDAKSERRAVEAPVIRRIFASSPRDPRYHMLEHLSAKFRTQPRASLLEPRAALILNRFTRTLTVMYATNAVSSILGVSPEEFKDKSFYECMQENCLPEAIRCLESAKANDSIAYLRFWYRNPRRDEDVDEEIREASQSSDSEDGGVELHGHMDSNLNSAAEGSPFAAKAPETSGNGQPSAMAASHPRRDNNRTSSGESTDLEQDAPHAMFDNEHTSRSSTSSLALGSPDDRLPRRSTRSPMPAPAPEPLEIEAVISCTSDGLVVILRRARPLIPSLQQPVQPLQAPQHANGVFAAPWGINPIRPHQYQPNARFPFQHGLQAPQLPAGGPPQDEFMNAIREVAVFAWSLTGINGNIASYAHGVPRGESQPPGGFPVWDPLGQSSPGYFPPENQAQQRWSRMGKKADEPLDGNWAPFQHPRQEQFVERHGYGSNFSMAPAYAFESQSGHNPGLRSWGTGPPGPPAWPVQPPEATHSHNSHSPHETEIGNPNSWYSGNK